MTINQLAGWFYDNNERIRSLDDNNEFLLFICLYAKTGFLLKDIDVDLGKIKIEDNSLIFSEFTNLEKGYVPVPEIEHILKSINLHDGCYGPHYIYGSSAAPANKIRRDENGNDVTDDILLKYFSYHVAKSLKHYRDGNFDFEPLFLSDNLFFFVHKDTTLTEKEIEYLKTFDPENYSGEHVFKDDEGKIQVF